MNEPRAARILVVEDDRTTADLVALYLRHGGYRVEVEHAGDRALARLGGERFDLLVLDVMLPGVDGLELGRRARDERSTPFILVTARTAEEQRIAGLDLGADDYVTKPFSPRELVARVRAVLRRVNLEQRDVLVRGPLAIDRTARAASLLGRELALTPSEYAILELLASRPGRVRSRAELLDALPGERADALERTIDAHVRNLRRKLRVDPGAPGLIRTVLGAGYRFDLPQSP